MSHYVDIITEIKDMDALVRALMRMDLKRNQIEVHDVAQNLIGYQGDKRKQKAHVIIRKRYVGSAANDIGFEKMPDGRFKSHISEYDSGKYNTTWQKKLYTYYGVEVAKAEAETLGYQVLEDTDEKERPRLRIMI